jgi:hypothetical protein
VAVASAAALATPMRAMAVQSWSEGPGEHAFHISERSNVNVGDVRRRPGVVLNARSCGNIGVGSSRSSPSRPEACEQ